tara:strand:+ start:62 stop:277 length:216 start_codon:yes stop_codon:yes gene_type:complete
MYLNYSGLKCPLPILRAKKDLKKITGGTKVTIISTDPSSPKDFKVLCETLGYKFLESKKCKEIYEIKIIKT